MPVQPPSPRPGIISKRFTLECLSTQNAKNRSTVKLFDASLFFCPTRFACPQGSINLGPRDLQCKLRVLPVSMNDSNQGHAAVSSATSRSNPERAELDGSAAVVA